MPIFDDMIHEEELWPVEALWPLRRARAALRRFEAKFPSLHYELVWSTRLMNAQAFIGEHGRTVRLYGGLGRHRGIGVEGLAFAVAHEVGHHLGGAPRHEFYRSISSEERADEWAAQVGLPKVFGVDIAARYITRGRAQLAVAWKRYARLEPQGAMTPDPYQVPGAGACGNESTSPV
jgi:hypothetical protein